MRKIVIIFAILAEVCLMQAQENQRFYYNGDGEKIYLNKVENTKMIHFKKSIEPSRKESILRQSETTPSTITQITPDIYRVLDDAQIEKNSIVSTVKASGAILYVSDVFMYADSTIQWMSDEIIVKIHTTSDLQNVLQENEIPFVDYRRLGSNEQTYAIALEVTENSAIEYANRLSESGGVEWAQPSFWRLARRQNSFFSSQWGLHNTGQISDSIGIDINAIEAWNLADGQGVKVAVLDDGVDLTHPDLINNLLQGYDATDFIEYEVPGSNPGGTQGGYGVSYDGHGTACTGIIAAQDNNIGVKGVAYNAKIIPIRIGYGYDSPYSTTFITRDDWIVDAFYKAWHDYDADVLSNSWGSGSSSVAIDNEITAALTQGRGALGCLVIFAAGNDNVAYIGYPERSNPDILVVGAMSPCGERKFPYSCDGENWGSSYGAELDVVAPGVLIPTTDIQGASGYNRSPFLGNDLADLDYTAKFNGTSSACPHVAGVAALVLSINPTLTGAEVRNIIESTAQKVRKYNPQTEEGYDYQTVSGRPNGMWDYEMGYGLVDAYAAVLKATCPTVINLHNQTINNAQTIAGCEVNVNNVTFNSPANVTISGYYKVEINSMVANQGSSVVIQAIGSGSPSSSSQSSSSPSGGFVASDDLFSSRSFVENEAESVEETTAPNTQARLYQNIPNPFTGETVIGYYIPESARSAYLRFMTATGVVAKAISLSAFGEGAVSISANELSAGVYFYTLVVDGQIVNSRQMVVGN